MDRSTARVTLAADPSALTVVLEGEDDLGRIRNVIDSHLKRFAFREEFEHLDWQAPEVAAAGS